MNAYLAKPSISLVNCFNTENWPYPWNMRETVLLIEIENMPQHVAVVRGGGQTYFGYDRDSFRKLRKNEV